MSNPLGYARLLVKRLDAECDALDTTLGEPREGRVIAMDRAGLQGLGVALGDRISFADRTADALQIDGQPHWILRENDVLAVLEQ
jgi:co-chaperonin GroES (HSP10)